MYKELKNEQLKTLLKEQKSSFQKLMADYRQKAELSKASFKTNDDDAQDKALDDEFDKRDLARKALNENQEFLLAALEQFHNQVVDYCSLYRAEDSSYFPLNTELWEYRYEQAQDYLLFISDEYDI